MKKRIKLMADYHCSALWQAGGDVGNINPNDLPLSAEAKRDLVCWSAQFDSWLNQEDPSNSGPPTEADRAQFNAEGRRLWQALRTELPEYEIVYWEAGVVHSV